MGTTKTETLVELTLNQRGLEFPELCLSINGR